MDTAKEHLVVVVVVVIIMMCVAPLSILVTPTNQRGRSNTMLPRLVPRRWPVPGRAIYHHRRHCRSYSHGATIGEVYSSYRKIDALLARLRPDQCRTTQEIDSMLGRGELTPTMAEHFKHDIRMMNEAKSTIAL